MNVSVFQKMKDMMPSMSRSQIRIAQFIIENPSKVLNMNILELARSCESSPSTVVEFSKKLGFSGYKSFQIALAQEIALFETLKPDSDRLRRICRDFLGFVFSELKQSVELISDEVLTRASDIILKSNVVEIFAYGFDSIAGKDLFLKLKEFGFQVNFFSNPFLQSISASHLGNRGCAVAISSSHSSTDLLDAISFSKKSGASVIAIASPSSKIAEVCDILLPAYARTEILSEGGFLTKYLQIVIVDLLILKMFEIDKDRLYEKYKHFETILSQKRRGDKGVF
ncbi:MULTISPECIES: MurR/RpiR family transcriptional regulator [Pseudothermotoga]|uniref:MurR/RpiR family transcriptional regulator n=1 Tax=Pseudothermotoga TaxID=1643951 RepID=UPI0003FB85CE|nr:MULTISPECIES: MurR/RpiR family transcriptional regulator [Pseudothermotoga]KUK21803.1 MAG: Transcriptional regulator, RpiR family [Pseudothermotoga lettingae]MDI3494026.1 RpiR family transcriptional regulator, carbohydrate utilization regulator [Pseudothermotoga sp.]MDK2884958.1 RpiR family transcriptional regulator, carbohydrate utilization regulator [Pseudothermotoga sp.]HBJ80530.1 MurR/RpiR family transcriptional regulator [Pseudothermotoga sp.]HBT25656.1 MurR/RpiR family transcriptional